jgi:hypothetical protein
MDILSMAWSLFESIYYITHRANLGSIISRGILSHNEIVRQDVECVDISDHGVQRWRSCCEPVFGRPIHDYVPLYMNPRNPMLFKRRELQNALVILKISTDALRRKDRLFSDGNAASRDTAFSRSSDVLGQAIPVLRAARWCDMKNGSRLRCAEALVFQHVASAHIQQVLCSNATMVNWVASNYSLPAVLDADFFF